MNFKYLFFLLVLVGCKPSISDLPLIDHEKFKTTWEGQPIELFTLKNTNGLVTQITNFGGRVVSLWVPDKNGRFVDIVLGFSSGEQYLLANEKYFGALIGRYGNRIAKGRFFLDSIEYVLATNNGENHLHGGMVGFNDVVWEATQIDQQTLQLNYLSADMEEGYPGNLEVKVVYQLTDKNELNVEYWATTDSPTILNLTHHSFFNLKGEGNGDINDHIMQINADYYTPVDSVLIPTGDIAAVNNTPMDFRKPVEIRRRIDEKFEQLILGRGYDHNWVLNKGDSKVQWAATVVEPQSGRILEVYTNEPGMQFYGGNFLNGSDMGKSGKMYPYRGAFCLETQHFPDSPNHESFPTTVLTPDQEYYSICTYRFGVSN